MRAPQVTLAGLPMKAASPQGTLRPPGGGAPMSDAATTIRDVAALEAIYGVPGDDANAKEVPYIRKHYRALIEAAPFAALATSGPGGLDVSPRGDAAGFIVVADEKTLLLPDRRGNNRVDSLRNII